jgi:UDP-N-acetyl-D-mannosaminuronic acid dehydrogenase
VVGYIKTVASNYDEDDHMQEGLHLRKRVTYKEFPLDIQNHDQEEYSFNKVLVIGLGQLGLPVARYIKEKGFDTYGYDISMEAMERAQKISGIKKVNNFGGIDVFIICVSTHKPKDMFSPQIDGLLSVVQQISLEGKNGALVSIESTIPRGTSKKVFEMLNHRMHVAHVPHRFYSLEENKHGVNQVRVVGGVCDCCIEAAIQFYSGSEAVTSTNGVARSIFETAIRRNRTNGNSNYNYRNLNLGIPLHYISNIEISEITKIAENAHRYLQIAFAEDLYLYCQANNINFLEFRNALNTKWNVDILEPRDGIGGHCLPKDTKMFLQSSQSFKNSKSKILAAALEVDQDYRRYRKVRGTSLQRNIIEQSDTNRGLTSVIKHAV